MYVLHIHVRTVYTCTPRISINCCTDITIYYSLSWLKRRLVALGLRRKCVQCNTQVMQALIAVMVCETLVIFIPVCMWDGRKACSFIHTCTCTCSLQI